ncbi:hypothetical protein GCM10017673_46970 [Streptosporangium violaceochromogenes]|nr:hypothetical protein GCM10017673_46970 [Streptosporangium violaceochromogenes]
MESLRARESGALMALYDAYAEGLYRYCRLMTGRADASRVALRDTLIAAGAHGRALADPDRLRVWLYALARGECLRRCPEAFPGGREPGGTTADPEPEGRGGARAGSGALVRWIPADGESEAPEESENSEWPQESGGLRGPGKPGEPGRRGLAIGAGDVADGASSRVPSPEGYEARLRSLAREAVSRLSPQEREVLELTFRHAMTAADLALVLGVAGGRAVAMREAALARLRDLVGLVTVEGLAREGVGDCADRASILAGMPGEPVSETREQVIRHIGECDTCAPHRAVRISAGRIFGLLPEAAPPETLRVRVTSCFTDPELALYRRYVARRVGPLDVAGFPLARVRGSRRGTYALVGAAATIGLIVTQLGEGLAG